MLDTVIECCDELKNLLDEFSDFKRSEKIKADHYQDQFTGGRGR